MDAGYNFGLCELSAASPFQSTIYAHTYIMRCCTQLSSEADPSEAGETQRGYEAEAIERRGCRLGASVTYCIPRRILEMRRSDL